MKEVVTIHCENRTVHTYIETGKGTVHSETEQGQMNNGTKNMYNQTGNMYNQTGNMYNETGGGNMTSDGLNATMGNSSSTVMSSNTTVHNSNSMMMIFNTTIVQECNRTITMVNATLGDTNFTIIILEKDIENPILEYTIIGLDPSSTYELEITVKNEYEWSMPTVVVFHTYKGV